MNAPTEKPSLRIEALDLVSSHFELKGISEDGPPDENKYRLELVSFEKRLDQDRPVLVALLGFDAFYEIAKPPIEARFAFAIRYRASGNVDQAWANLKDPIILAHALPYVREFLSSMTSRMPVPTLMVGVSNAHAMFEAFQRRSKPLADTSVAE